MKIKQAALLIVSISAFIITGNAQLLINDFSDLPNQVYDPSAQSWNGGTGPVEQYVQDAGFVSIKPVNGGNPTGDGNYFSVISGNYTVPGPIQDFTPYGFVEFTARIDSGNASSGFTLFLADSQGMAAVSAWFSASAFNSTFTTVTSKLDASIEGGNIADIQFYRIAGDGSSDAFRASFDNAVATSVPEPGTCALLGLGGAMVLLGYRRKV